MFDSGSYIQNIQRPEYRSLLKLIGAGRPFGRRLTIFEFEHRRIYFINPALTTRVFSMLKQTCLYLFVFISQQHHAANDIQSQSDTLNKVSIKVILRPKSLDTSQSLNFDDLRNSDSIIRQTDRKGPYRSLNKKHTPTKPKDISNSLLVNNFQSQSPVIDDTLKSDAHKFKKEQTLQRETETKHQKNIFLLISLVLIMTGIVIAIFFRSGFPFTVAVLFVIIGYYILTYVLLYI